MKNRLMLFVLLQLIFVASHAQKIPSSKIVGKWQFVEISIVSPNKGYLIHFGEQEINLLKILVANYTFNADESVGLSEEYTKRTGITSAKWKMNADQTGINITYNFTIDSTLYPRNRNAKETFLWKIESVSATDLSLSIEKMFIVKLKKAAK